MATGFCQKRLRGQDLAFIMGKEPFEKGVLRCRNGCARGESLSERQVRRGFEMGMKNDPPAHVLSKVAARSRAHRSIPGASRKFTYLERGRERTKRWSRRSKTSRGQHFADTLVCPEGQNFVTEVEFGRHLEEHRQVLRVDHHQVLHEVRRQVHAACR